jgi:hypothetical protein
MLENVSADECAYVRFGSEADMTQERLSVTEARSRPDSGHSRVRSKCQLCANSVLVNSLIHTIPHRLHAILSSCEIVRDQRLAAAARA